MKKAIILFLALSGVLYTDCEAVSALERFFLGHPDFLRVFVIAVCLVMLAAIMIFRIVYGPDRGPRGAKGYQEPGRGGSEDAGAIHGAKPAKLINVYTQKTFTITASAGFTIGRAFDNTLVLDNSSVSRYHAKIVYEAGGYVIYDLASKKGTMVNGEFVERKLLKDSDIIEIGRDDMLFSVG